MRWSQRGGGCKRTVPEQMRKKRLRGREDFCSFVAQNYTSRVGKREKDGGKEVTEEKQRDGKSKGITVDGGKETSRNVKVVSAGWLEG